MQVGFDDEQACHSRIFDYLHGVENADEGEISGESYVGANFLRRFIARHRQIRDGGRGESLRVRERPKCAGRAVSLPADGRTPNRNLRD